VTNILPRERGEEILAAHASGMPVREIARTYGHSPGTIRDYVRGRRVPGEPAPRTDDLAPFAGYCRQRLADDPHLRTPGLLAELQNLGLDGSRATIYRGLERRGLRPHPCPDCHVARISGYAPLSAARRTPLFPLPVPAAPVAGETLTSFLGRLAAANRTSTDTLLGILPPWFRIKTRWHDDRWQHPKLAPWAGNAAGALAVISSSSTAGITNALPAFGGNRGQPVRAATACRLCAAACRGRGPVPVHLPAHHQVCLRHGIWLSAPGTPQFSVSSCPDILNAERRARRLARDHGIEQLIYARTRVPEAQDALAWKRRTAALIESNPRTVTENSPQSLFQAAAYPDAIIAASVSRKNLS
jgi:hypothetical protein